MPGALDITSDVRIPVLFHADDPVFLASSRGEANRVLSIVRTWASKYKATLHLAKHKTTAMVLPASTHSARAQVLPLRYLPVGQSMPCPISWAHSHKSWDDKADFAVHARRSCGMCSGTVQALSSLLRSGHIPLAVACIIFDTKVEAALRFGRWLWGTHSEAVAVLSDAYASWARLLLGSSRWRSAEVCRQSWAGSCAHLLELWSRSPPLDTRCGCRIKTLLQEHASPLLICLILLIGQRPLSTC